MGSMSYSLKAKCQGCAALKEGKEGYTCSLGIALLQERIGNTYVHPSPDNTKCYKPRTAGDLSRARELMAEKV